jgi:CubicO group peptidase (beta-lactamase class C family)
VPQRNDAADLRTLLEQGLSQGLYQGASAGASTPAGRVLVSVGTLAVDDPTPVTADTLFDLASVSKTFTAAVAVLLAEQGRLNLDEPVADVLAVGSGQGAERITLRMLLTHVSGLPAESFLWRDAGIPEQERMSSVLASRLESAPDEVYRYSCVGYIAAGAVAEQVTGSTLPQLVDELIGRPLGLSSLGYGPVEPSRTAATEAQPWAGRGMLRGEVHDELNRFLGGRAGNAGLFATAADILAFAESFLDRRLFSGESLRLLTRDALSPHHGAPFGQALGPRIGDRDFLADGAGFGHIGFTGTMWAADPGRGWAATLLTNSVHPRRDRVDLSAFRRRFTAWTAARAEAEQ